MARMGSRSLQALLLLGAVTLVSALPHAKHRNIKRQVEELRDSYDFVVVGGGTAGLTVADRLSEAFPDRNTLVIEYGVVEEAVAVFEPPGAGEGTTRLALSSLPIPALNDRRGSVMMGMTVGGSSTLNGQFFDRGSKHDYDEWAAIGSPEFDDSEERWDFDGILPFFKKSVTFHEPPEEDVEAYGYTWDAEAAYGGETPIHAVFAAYQFPIQKVCWDAFVEMGVAEPKECAAGEKAGLCWVPTSQHPDTGARSHAGIGHYQDVIEGRDNYDLLVGHKVTRLVFSDADEAPAVEFKPVGSDSEDDMRTVTPNLEVVVSAGAIHTPQILQRSGIGEASFLEGAGIEVVADVPGVGWNFQDHAGPTVSFRLTEPIGLTQTSLQSNATFREEALAQYEERPARGPYTLAMGNSAIYIPLSELTEDHEAILEAIREQVEDGTALDYLPEDVPASVADGYLAQLSLLADSLADPGQPILEAPWMTSAPGVGFLLKPLSRGSVRIDPENHDAEPLLDYRTGANPLDMDVMASFIPFFRRYFATDIMQGLGATEVSPGENVTELADLVDSIRGNVNPSFMHPCCTASMMPLEKGGVVGPDLKVHGLGRVRVADISIIPIIPGTHTSATAYAIGEKAADIIIRAWAYESEVEEEEEQEEEEQEEEEQEEEEQEGEEQEGEEEQDEEDEDECPADDDVEAPEDDGEAPEDDGEAPEDDGEAPEDDIEAPEDDVEPPQDEDEED